ncbi:MAG TPA: BTAD domain-containing putative transcriptional regulator [Vicinamibacteria bacterium]|nr:BTAD domain-containing putative transcriptional regulator [Vicinamibacteria bacterium]
MTRCDMGQMRRLNLTLIGDFQARIGQGPPLRLRTRKAQALLAYLAMPAGLPHSRDKLAALLWGDRPLPQARGRFRETLFALRRALAAAEPPCLTTSGDAVALEGGAVDIDVFTFTRFAAAGDVESLTRAMDLYRGEFLEGLVFRGTPFEDWLMAERERLREVALETMARLLTQQRRAGATSQALRTALRLSALDPLQESVHRTLMRLYSELGRRGAALQQYQVCVETLQVELGIEPEKDTRQLYQDLLSRPPAASSAETPNGVPEVSTLRRGVAAQTTDSPLIGRDAELAQLRPIVTGHGNRGRVLILVGEAGVGKTRLVSELTMCADASGRRVLLGRCHESEQILPFAPWLAVLKAARVTADEAQLGGLPAPMRRELGRLLPELWSRAADDGSAADALMLFEGVSVLLERVAAAQPSVVVLEDLHWADEMSVRLLAFIGRRLEPWRLVVLVTAREEDLVDAPVLHQACAELKREPHVDTVALGPLSREHTGELVRALARGHDDVTVARLSEQIWRASEGNPLVVVEATRIAAHEALSPELETLSVPERVRDIIGRQLERLGVGARDLVGQASVIGREFDFELLQRVSGRDEEAVARGVEELIRRRLLRSVGDRLDFHHDRVREVVYEQILLPRRRALHRRVAEAMETLHARDPEEYELALGRHFFEGEVWEKAVLNLRRAGKRALERFAKREAVACFERALTALAHLPREQSTLEQGFEIRLELRPALNQLGEMRRVLELLREAEALARQLEDDCRRGRVRAFMSVAYFVLGEVDEAVAAASDAREIAERVQDPKLRLLATNVLEQAISPRGEFERIVELAIENLAILPVGWLGESFGRFAPTSIYDRVYLVRSLAELGRFDQAARYAAEAIELAEPSQYAYAIGMAYWASGVLWLMRGDWMRARSAIEHGTAALETADAVLTLPGAIACGAWVLAQLGEAEEAVRRLREAETVLQTGESRQIVANNIRAYHALGRAQLLLDRPADARRAADRGLAYSRSRPADAAHALHLRGDVAMHPEAFDPESAEADYGEAMVLATSFGMRPLVAHCHLGLGRVYLGTGQRAGAREHLTNARTMYREMGMTYWLEKASAEFE